jgi:hypothetical protein
VCAANQQWCADVNAVVHSEICAIPDSGDCRTWSPASATVAAPEIEAPSVRRKVDRLTCTRYASPLFGAFRADRRHRGCGCGSRRVCILEPATAMIVAEHEVVAPGAV